MTACTQRTVEGVTLPKCTVVYEIMSIGALTLWIQLTATDLQTPMRLHPSVLTSLHAHPEVEGLRCIPARNATFPALSDDHSSRLTQTFTCASRHLIGKWPFKDVKLHL